MKNRSIFSALLIAVMCFTQDVLAQEKESGLIKNVPKEISVYVKKHFSGVEIQQSEKNGTEYEVNLTDGTELEFNKKFEIVEIENENGLSNDVLPIELKKYLVENYPENKVTQWSLKDSGKQKIELDDEANLVFDASGNFLSIGR